MRLQTSALTVVVEKSPYRLTFFSPTSGPAGETAPGSVHEPLAYRTKGGWQHPAGVLSYALSGTTHRFSLATTEPSRTIELSIDFPEEFRAVVKAAPSPSSGVLEVRESLLANADEGLFGGGERFNRVEMRGETAELWALHQHGFKYLPAQIKGQSDNCPVPVVLSTRGWAVSFDTTARGTLAFPDAGLPGAVVLSVEDDTLSYHVVVAKEPLDLVGRTAGAFGRPRLPPRWMFAPMKWRDDVTQTKKRGEELLLEDAQKMQKHAIPCGAVWLDNPWMLGWGDYDFKPAHFPDPDRLIQDLAALDGTKLVAWACPYLETGTQALVESKANGFHVKNAASGTPIMVDLTNPAAMTWWKERVKPLLKRGVMGIKADRGEETVLGDSARYFDGKSDRVNHNRYPLLWAQAVSEAVREVHGDEGVSIGRCGGAGAWRHWTALWTGDNISWINDPKGFKADVRAHITASLSGFAFVGGDAGGYIGKTLPSAWWNPLGSYVFPDPPTLLRWFQFASVTPLLECGGVGAHEVWAMEKTLPGATSIYRRYATLHVELFPTFYGLAQEATTTGHPLVRALWLTDPANPKLRAIDDEFLLGEDVLAAPVLDDGTGLVPRTIVLPAGTWVDWWTGVPKTGTITRASPLDEMPLYLRTGVPLALDFRDEDLLGFSRNDLGRPDRLGLAFAPLAGSTSSRTLFDGTKVSLECGAKSSKIAVAMSTPRTVGFKVYGRVTAVRANGKTLAPIAKGASGDGFVVSGPCTLVRVSSGTNLVVEIDH